MKIKKRHQPVDFQAVGYPESEEAALQRQAVADAAPEEELFEAPFLRPAFEVQDAAPPAPPPTRTEVSSTQPKTPAPRAEPVEVSGVKTPSGWPIYLTALVVSALWICAPIAFALGYRQSLAPFTYEPFAIMVFALLAIGPAVLVWLAAYMARQGQKLGVEARRAKAFADEMLTPVLAAGVQTQDMVAAMREEIARAGTVANEARETLLAMREVLAAESERLIEATAASARTANGLAETLGRERVEMGELAKSLDAQAVKVSDTIIQHAKMVGEASDLAETQLREAEAALAARAADLAAAAGETSDAARTAADDLTRHIARLESAGVGVTEQIAAVEAGLSQQRAGLVETALTLRTDQEGFAAQAETQAAKLAEFIGEARLSTLEMSDRATRGGDALRQMLGQAVAQFHELALQAQAERDGLGESTLDAIDAVSRAAAAERTRLEAETRATIENLTKAADETRLAAERHAETARNQLDQLSEAAFTAGQQANSVFESRLEEAKALIDQSTRMVEQAGAATAAKLEEGARLARATLAELTSLLGDIEQRAARLPDAARGQADEVRRAVAESIEDLMDQARRTADETQAIDEAFQGRVRRNYEMLSEAVRMMGAVAVSGATPPPPIRRERTSRAEPPAYAAPEAPVADAPPEPAAPVAVAARAPEAKPEPDPVKSSVADVAGDEDDDLELTQPATPSALRPRLRLTPTATDAEFTQVFDQASGRGEGQAGWTWKDLLSSIDETEGGDEPQNLHAPLEDVLAGEIGAMGIDPAALLPRSRVEELAAAIQARDMDGAREVIRRLAPAATRRLSRRLATDDVLKGQVITFIARYHSLLDDAATRDHEGFLVTTLLSSEAGRTYLLFDAAVGDLG